MRDWIITKRLLGLILLAGGAVGFLGVLALDFIRDSGRDFGPAQLLALAGCAGLAVIGLTLIPLGDRPA